MPDTKTELQQNMGNTAAPAVRKVSAMERCFVPVAHLSVVGAIAYLTYFMDKTVMEGQLTGVPYVLITLLFGCLLGAYHIVSRDE